MGRARTILWSCFLAASAVLRGSVEGQEPDVRLEISEIDAGGSSEWIELHNPSAGEAQLQDFQLEVNNVRAEDLHFIDFPEGFFVPAGGFFVVCFTADLEIGCNDPCLDECCDLCLQGNLDRDGGIVTLFRGASCRIFPPPEVVDRVTYPPLPSEPAKSSDRFCVLATQTPGAGNAPCLPNGRRVLINEVYTAGGDPSCRVSLPLVGCEDFVELYLPGDDPVNLEDYVIQNGDNRAILPNVELNASNRYFLILASSLPQPSFPGFQALFGLKRSGDSLALRSPDNSEFDRVTVPSLGDGVSYARVPDGGEFRSTVEITVGSANAVTETGVPPEVVVIDRLPLRVTPGSEVTVVASVRDADGDLDEDSILLRWRPATPDDCPCDDSIDEAVCLPVDAPGAGDAAPCERPGGPPDEESFLCPMKPGKRRTCVRSPEPWIFVGTFRSPDMPGLLTFSVVAEDELENRGESQRLPLRVQPEDWQDPIQPTHLLRINEVSSRDAEVDRVEIVNLSAQPVVVGGMYLTDNIFRPRKAQFPQGTVIPPVSELPVCGTRQSGFLVVFLDGGDRPDFCDLHFPFRLNSCVDEVILIHSDGCTVVDSLEVKESKRNRTLGRFPNGSDDTLALMEPTLGRANELVACFELTPPDETATVVINELLADNKSTKDDDGGEFGDYLELYNRSDDVAHMDGWELRDLGRRDQDPPRTWRFPPGACVPPRGYLLVWCDNDECENEICDPDPLADGPCCLNSTEIHTGFEISRLREFIQLVDAEGNVVDCASIGFQARDISVGRVPDGEATLHFVTPSPAAANAAHPEDSSRGGALEPISCAAVDERLSESRPDPCGEQPPTFKRGDANQDCAVDISDAAFTLNWLFLGGPEPRCMDAADSDDDGQIVVTDPILTLSFLFAGGPPPSSPGPDETGPDATEDTLAACEEDPDCT